MATDRIVGKCTGCGAQLPRNRPNWGLVWDSNVCGMCKACLYSIRSSIGYYERFPDHEKRDKPKDPIK